mmetsp:Transcript_34615/g.112615  ORF Transcript_34615/g.112615 Transcript_34615/m.112615 type:complete len:217 (-) Transcript_34615:5023-5673(-)
MDLTTMLLLVFANNLSLGFTMESLTARCALSRLRLPGVEARGQGDMCDSLPLNKATGSDFRLRRCALPFGDPAAKFVFSGVPGAALAAGGRRAGHLPEPAAAGGRGGGGMAGAEVDFPPPSPSSTSADDSSETAQSASERPSLARTRPLAARCRIGTVPTRIRLMRPFVLPSSTSSCSTCENSSRAASYLCISSCSRSMYGCRFSSGRALKTSWGS